MINSINSWLIHKEEVVIMSFVMRSIRTIK